MLPVSELGAMMVEWLERRYQAGRIANDGSQMQAAIRSKYPEFGRHGSHRLARAH